MKKKHSFNILSNKECETKNCKTKLKLRLVETRDPKNIRVCFKCHKVEQGKRHHVMK